MSDLKPKSIVGKEMPNSIEAEQAVLCSAMIDDEAALTLLSNLRGEDFFSEAHRNIFEAMQYLFNNNIAVDFVSVIGQLERASLLELSGGIAYLTSINGFLLSAANHLHYLELVKQNSLQRAVIRSCNQILEKAYYPFDPNEPQDDVSVLQFAEQNIYELAEREEKSKLVPIRGAINQAIAEAEEISKDPNASRGIMTPFRRLNRMLNGLNKGDLVVIAARPGMGKTSLAMNMIEHAAINLVKKVGDSNQYSCAVFALEMPSSQLARRMLCSVGQVSLSRLNSGALKAPDWKRIMHARKQIEESKIYIDDSSLITPAEILSKCRRLKRERGLDIVMIDYLTLLSSGKRKNENRVQEISEMTRMLKIAAKELDVPILLLSQLNREVEKRAAKGGGSPQLSDLRDSGSVEQDADIVIFIENQFGKEEAVDEYSKSLRRIIVAKNRNGETGEVSVRWIGEQVRFEDNTETVAVGSNEHRTLVQEDADTQENYQENTQKNTQENVEREQSEPQMSGREAALRAINEQVEKAIEEVSSVFDDED